MPNEFRVFGPPGCLCKTTIVNIRRGKRNFGRPITIEQAYYKFNKLDIPKKFGINYPWRGNHPALIMSLQNDILMYHEIDMIVDSGFKELFELKTKGKRSIRVTKEHPFKKIGSFVQLQNLKIGDTILCKSNRYSNNGRQKNKKRNIVYSVQYHPHGWDHFISGKNYKRISMAKAVYEADMNNLNIKNFIEIIRHKKERAKKLKYLKPEIVVHHKDNNPLNDKLGNLELITKNIHDELHGECNIRNFGYFKPVKDVIISIKSVGMDQTYDIVMKSPYHNYVAQEFIVHNTGKTSRLATRDIPRAVERYGPEGVMVTSFTKAAAFEISKKKSRDTGMNIPVAPENVGTIHSILYHAFSQPLIMEVHYKNEWNEKYPQFKISGSKIQIVDETSEMDSKAEKGDVYLNSINIKRNKMIPMKIWRSDIRAFYNKWCEFKREMDCMDFTDMVEKGLNEFDMAPNNPKVIFVDEAQDFTKLQLSLIRKWGQHSDWIILVGDDDQTIFEFTGADPTAFLDPPIDKKFKTVLKKSWRVPKAILERSTKLISKVSRREEKEYSPRLDENGKIAMGEVRNFRYTYNDGKEIVKLAKEYANQNMSVMILASCSYMLNHIKKELKDKAIPFHNPYRRRRRDWNPLYHQNTLIDFLESGIDGQYWNVPQFVSWAKHLQVGDGTNGLARNIGNKGIKRLQQAIEDMEPGLHTCKEVFADLVAPGGVQPALDRNIDWFMDNISPAKKSVLEYPVSIFKQYGKDTLSQNPKILIGTIHSVKGAESDVVILFPDISFKAYEESGTQAGKDSMHRLFYVGMTRAKHILILCNPVVMVSSRPKMYIEM